MNCIMLSLAVLLCCVLPLCRLLNLYCRTVWGYFFSSAVGKTTFSFTVGLDSAVSCAKLCLIRSKNAACCIHRLSCSFFFIIFFSIYLCFLWIQGNKPFVTEWFVVFFLELQQQRIFTMLAADPMQSSPSTTLRLAKNNPTSFSLSKSIVWCIVHCLVATVLWCF